MSYEKQTWTNGEVITAEKMNHLENGVAEGGDGDGIFWVNFSQTPGSSTIVCDKTYEDIEAAKEAKATILGKFTPNGDTVNVFPSVIKGGDLNGHYYQFTNLVAYAQPNATPYNLTTLVINAMFVKESGEIESAYKSLTLS